MKRSYSNSQDTLKRAFEPSLEEQPVTGKRQKSPTSFHDPNDGGEGDILGSSNGDAPVVVDLISNLPPAPKYFTSGGCSHMDRWGSFFCLLVEYRFEKGHANPKKTEEYRSRKLGQWCSEQRKNYQKRVRGMLSAQSRLMSDERIALLVAVGMQFSKQQDPQAFVSIQGAKTWDGMLDLLKRYHREKGHLNPGETEVFCGERIGVWCCRQKEAFRAKQEGSSSSASGYQVCNYCTNRLIQTGFDFAAGPPPAQATSHSLHPHPGSATAMGEISDPLAHQMTPLMPPISSSSNAHAIASPTPTISDMPIPAGLIPASSLEGMMGTLDPISGQPTAMARSLTPVTPGEVQSASSPKPDGDSPSSNATSSGKSSAIKSKKTDEGSAWDEMFNLLVEYSKEHGHVAPRWGENFNEKKLGRWVSTQREAFKKRKNGKLAANSCRMSDERIAKLNGIGFSWETAAGKASSSSWDDVFQILCRYKNLHGHCCPTEKEEYEGKLIGRWVKTQREAFRMRQQGKLKETSCRMSDDRIRMLNDIGFVWDAREQTNSVSASAGKTPTSNSWEDGYNVMVAYKATHGHSCPTEKEEFTCPNTGNIHKVGRWAKTQREAYRMRQQGKLSSTSCRMNDERIALLEKIDFVWDARNRNDVASSSSTSGIKQDETDSSHRIKQLEENIQTQREQSQVLPSPEPKKPDLTKWEQYYQCLTSYRDQNHHTIPLMDEMHNGMDIGRWVQLQRDSYKSIQEGKSSNELDDTKIALLNDLCFVWALPTIDQDVDREEHDYSAEGLMADSMGLHHTDDGEAAWHGIIPEEPFGLTYTDDQDSALFH